jgi:hypothetical protein
MNHDENVSLERALESAIRVSWMEPKYPTLGEQRLRFRE